MLDHDASRILAKELTASLRRGQHLRGNLDTWSYVQQFGKDKLRGVVTIDMSPLPLSPDQKWWTEGTIEELSGRHTGVDFF